MTAQLRIERVLGLPSELTPSTMYLVKSEHDGLVEIAFSTMDGSGLLEVVNHDLISDMIADSMTTAGAIFVVDVVEDLDSLELDTNSLALVLNEVDTEDPSYDPDAEHPGQELYMYMASSDRWILINTLGAPSEGGQAIWGQIVGQPDVTKEEVELAVEQTHTHDNKDVLDGITLDEHGNFLVNGDPISAAPGVQVSEW